MSDANRAPEPSMDEILASIRRILAEDEAPAPRLPPRPRPNGDVLDLTEAIDDDGTIRHIPPPAAVPSAAAAPALPDGRIEPAPPRPPAAGDVPPLVSDTVSAAIAASFARLAAAQSEKNDDGRLDELVSQTLRPLLQAWLDEHLPALVERLVRAEIARVVDSRPTAP
jgi:hypothetical protein